MPAQLPVPFSQQPSNYGGAPGYGGLGSMQGMGLGAGLGQLAGGLYGMFHKGANPQGAANQYLNQIPDVLKQYMQPYMNAGQGALGDVSKQFGDLTGNTGDVYNRLASGYKQSPGYQRALQEALGAGSNAAAAGGMLGTPQHEQQNMGIASDIASKDFGNYMQNIMGLYGTGLSGQQDLSHMGFQGANDLSSSLANLLGTQGQYAYGDATQQNVNNQQNMQNVFGGLGSMLPFLFGL